MAKLLFLLLCAFLFSACSVATYSYNDKGKNLIFKKAKDNLHFVQLSNPKVTATFDSCSLFSYTLQDNSSLYGKIFIEHINLQSDCQFNGDSLGFLLYEFKENLKLKSFKQLEFIKYNNYEFYTYKINDEKIVNFIFIFSVLEDTFIIDYEGKLYQEVVKQFDETYLNKYLDNRRFEENYNYSLVRMNIFKGYFNRNTGDFFE